MSSRPTRAATLALVLGAFLLGLNEAPAAETPAPAKKQGGSAPKKAEATPDAKPDDPDAAPVRATAGGADIPVGVTLYGPRPPAAIAREQLQPGVTLLGPPPQVTWPRLVYRVPGGETSLASGLVPPLALPAPGRPTPRAPDPVVRVPRAADPGAQLAPLAAPPLTAWTAFPGSIDWAPQSAFPAADPEAPYPWNPVRWSGGDWLESGWSPSSAWPPGVNAENWSPVLWSSPPAWTEWQPRDAWDRLLEPEESEADDSAAGSPPAPSGRARQD
jgi:hypothetical protein